jgi:glycerol uptake facilitator-like aquaporin
VLNAFLIETIVTWLFVQVNLLVKTKRTSPSGEGLLGAFVVATTLLAAICVSGSKTGGCVNPAVGLAQTIWLNVVGAKDMRTWDYLWMYLAAPATGGVIASISHAGHVWATARFQEVELREDGMPLLGRQTTIVRGDYLEKTYAEPEESVTI